jgi:hypothetical protein
MKGRQSAAAALLLLLAGAGPAGAQASLGDVESDDPEGASALRQLAEATGHQPTLLRDRFDLPATGGVLFVIEPETAFSATEASRVRDWLADGGVLVYASWQPDSELEAVFDLARSDAAVSGGTARVSAPLLAGVRTVALSAASPFISPSPDQTVFLRTAKEPAGIEGHYGKGRYYAIASSLLFSNRMLGVEDNGRLAAELLAAGGPGGAVIFDQFHHGGGAGQSSSLAWIATPWGLAIVLEVLLVFSLLAIRGRAFGPLIPLRAPTDPASTEFTSAVGALLRRARANRQAAGRLLAATRAAVGEQVGVRGGMLGDRLETVLRHRSPALAGDLERATAAADAVVDDPSFARAAADLHRLAHPPMGQKDENPPPAP